MSVKTSEKRRRPEEPTLFSENEMVGAVSKDVFDQFADAYLKAMQILCRLDDMEFYNLAHEYQSHHEIGEAYYLHALPTQILTEIQFMALGDCINMRSGYRNNPSSKPHVIVPSSFGTARARFLEECANDVFGHTEWISRLSVDEII